MHPLLCTIGPVPLYTYGLFVALGLLISISLALKHAKKNGEDPQVILDLAFYSVLAGIIGSRIFYVAQNFSYYKENLLSMVKLWEGGLVFQGGLIIGLPVAWVYLKKNKLSFWKTFDLLAPYMPIGQAFGRIGCFFAGCCYGKPTDLPWGVVFTDPKTLALPGIPLHPAQLYSAAGLFLTSLLLILFRKHTRFIGQLSCMYLLLHSFFRILNEYFRGDPRAPLWEHYFSLTQGISLLTFFIALGLYFYLKNRKLIVG